MKVDHQVIDYCGIQKETNSRLELHTGSQITHPVHRKEIRINKEGSSLNTL